MSDDENIIDPLSEEGEEQPINFFEDDAEEKKDAPAEPVDKETLERALHNIKKTVHGNGYPVDKITIKDFEGEIFNFEAIQLLEIETEVSERQVNGKERGEKAGSRQDMQAKIRATVERISRDRDVRSQAISMMRKRPDLGYATDGLILNLDKFGKQYVVHEPCNQCETKGRVKCHSCHGRQEIVCHYCHGTREMQCTQCQGRQFMETARGRVQCNLCHGKGRIGCRTCQQTGKVKCHICKGQGFASCTHCGSTGWHSLVSLLRIKAKGTFDYNRAAVPEEAAALLDEYGPRLVTEEHILARIEEEHHKLDEHNRLVKENQMAVPYEVKLPWGDLTVNFGSNPVKGNLFGFKGLFLNTEPYLQKILGKGLKRLQEAGNGIGDVAEKVEIATKYRTIAEVFLIGGRMPPKRAYMELRNKYPSGIEDEALMGMINSAHKSLSHLTDKPRKVGMAAGVGGSLVIFAAYFFTFRNAIAASLPQQEISMIIDLLILGAGIGVTALMIKSMAASAVKKALHRVTDKKTKIPTKAGNTIMLASMGVVAVYAIAIIGAWAAGFNTPFWLHSLLPPTQ